MPVLVKRRREADDGRQHDRHRRSDAHIARSSVPSAVDIYRLTAPVVELERQPEPEPEAARFRLPSATH